MVNKEQVLGQIFLSFLLSLLLSVVNTTSSIGNPTQRNHIPKLNNPSTSNFQPTSQKPLQKNRRKIRFRWTPPTGVGAPYIRVAGATRGACGITDQTIPAFIALHPDVGEGISISDHPTLWVYVPQGFAPDEIRLVIQGSRSSIYNKTLPRLKTGGIVGLKLPESLELMKPGERTEWQIKILCNSQIDITRGSIRRASLTQSQQQKLRQLSAEEKLEFYGQQGFWYEALTTIAELRMQYPNDMEVASAWKNLIKDDRPSSNQLTLESLYNKPVIDIIQVSP